MDSVVKLENAGKRYIKYDDVPLLLTHALRFRAGHRRTHLWAVRHVDAEVGGGESLGVIGRNGSGKSTMFQMLAGVTAPTEGRVRVRGRVAPLISVGIGFHPELTGRENVYVNGTILGLTKSEIDRRFDQILNFAEIEAFIDTPVKFYSSGMFVRLGFSVAVAADPEVLLIDEVLAVGDVAFQMRCYDRMEEIRRNGSTILVVSHAMNAIRRLCSRVLLLHDGEPRFLGDADEGISKYHEILGEIALAGRADNTPELEFLDLELFDSDGRPTAHVQTGDIVTLRGHVRFTEPAEDPVFGFQLHKDNGIEVYAENTAAMNFGAVVAGQVVRVETTFEASLPTASYIARASAYMGRWEGAGRAKAKPLTFFCSGRPFVNGMADLGAKFSVASVDGAEAP
jgi:ABC-type polysaccharide/polyol phosphate transport system ATPase subunit